MSELENLSDFKLKEQGKPIAEPKTFPLWAGLLCSVVGGLLMFAAFPPLDESVCVWVGLIPLMTALWSGRKREGKKGFFVSLLYGWLFGLVYYGGSFWWINEVSTLGYVPFMMYLAIYPALWAGLMGSVLRPAFKEVPAHDSSLEVRKQRWKDWSTADMIVTAKAVFTGAALWVCIEWLRCWVFTGFGWNSLGVALYEKLALAQFAEYVGVIALSFIPAMVNIWLWCVGRRLGKMMIIEGRRVMPWDFFVMCTFMMILFVVGTFVMNNFGRLAAQGEKLPVVAIQPNMSQKYKWDRNNILTIYRQLAQSTADAIEDVQEKSIEAAVKEPSFEFSQPAWVIWPESSLPMSDYLDEQGKPRQGVYHINKEFFADGGFVSQVREAAPSDFVIITGSDEFWSKADDEAVATYNVLSAIPGDYDSRLTYRKIHLVPFGEYIPLRKALPILEKAFEFSAGGAMGANFDSGTSYEPLNVPLRPGSESIVQIIPSVCFEDTVGRLLRQFVRGEPQVIVNVTNDGWFNKSWANEQHWRNGAFRAIELRRAMIRAANTGVTVAISPTGAVIGDLRSDKGSPFIEGYLSASLPIGYEGITLYAFLGDWAVIVCALFVVISILFGCRKCHLRNHS